MPGVQTMAPAAVFFLEYRGRGRWRSRGSVLSYALACQFMLGGTRWPAGSVMALPSCSALRLGASHTRSSVPSVVCCFLHFAPLCGGSFVFPCLEGSTPSLSYMNCLELVQCVPPPLANKSVHERHPPSLRTNHNAQQLASNAASSKCFSSRERQVHDFGTLLWWLHTQASGTLALPKCPNYPATTTQ